MREAGNQDNTQQPSGNIWDSFLKSRGGTLPEQPSNPVPVLKLLTCIVDREQSKKLLKILDEGRAHIQYQCAGVGSANSEIANMLDLGGKDKMIALCLLPDMHVNLIRTALL